jgi:hypothetical protein
MVDEGGHPSDCMPLRSCCVVHPVCGESVMDLASKIEQSGGIAEESMSRTLAVLVVLRKADCLNAKAHVTWTCTASHHTPHSTLGKCYARRSIFYLLAQKLVFCKLSPRQIAYEDAYDLFVPHGPVLIGVCLWGCTSRACISWACTSWACTSLACISWACISWACILRACILWRHTLWECTS